MENIEIAFNNPETGFGDIATFQSTDNGVGAGNKNILTATIHANGDVLELPMNYDATFRGSDKQKKTFEENYQKLKDYQLSIINAKDINEVVRTVIDPAQIAGLVESFDEGNLSLSALNTQLATINYEVKPIYEEITNNSLGSNNNKNKPETKIAGYELLKNGLPFNLLAAENDLSLNGLQAYLRNNLSSKETGIIKESINNDYSRWVQIQQSRKLNIQKNISSNNNFKVINQYIKDNTLAKKIPEYLRLVNEKGDVNLSEEEINRVCKNQLEHFNANPNLDHLFEQYYRLLQQYHRADVLLFHY